MVGRQKRSGWADAAWRYLLAETRPSTRHPLRHPIRRTLQLTPNGQSRAKSLFEESLCAPSPSSSAWMTSIRLAGRRGGERWTDAHRARHAAHVKEMVTRDSVEAMARWLERADPPASEAATMTRGWWRRLPGTCAWAVAGARWRQSSRPGALSMAGSAAGARRACS